MKSQSSIALKELLNESAMIVEEFQAQCILMANEFSELAKGNFTSDYDYPTFTNEVKKILYFPTTVTKEVSSIDQIFKDVEVNEGDSYIDSLLIEMAKRTRKPLGQSFMKKVRHTFPKTPYRNIQARIVRLISEGKIIDYSENDTEKPKRGHPKTKVDNGQPYGQMQQKLTEKLQQFQQNQQFRTSQLQQLQQLQQIQRLQQIQQLQQNQQKENQETQNQQNQENEENQDQQNQDKTDINSQMNEINVEAMAEDLSSELLSNHQFGSLNEILDDDSIGFETPFYQDNPLIDSSPPQIRTNMKEEENNASEMNESHPETEKSGPDPPKID